MYIQNNKKSTVPVGVTISGSLFIIGYNQNKTHSEHTLIAVVCVCVCVCKEGGDNLRDHGLK